MDIMAFLKIATSVPKMIEAANAFTPLALKLINAVLEVKAKFDKLDEEIKNLQKVPTQATQAITKFRTEVETLTSKAEEAVKAGHELFSSFIAISSQDDKKKKDIKKYFNKMITQSNQLSESLKSVVVAQSELKKLSTKLSNYANNNQPLPDTLNTAISDIGKATDDLGAVLLEVEVPMKTVSETTKAYQEVGLD